MQTNPQVQFNLGTFNIPTLLGILSIAGLIWSQSADRASLDTKVDARLSSIETDRTNAKAAMNETIRTFNTQIDEIPNLMYRLQKVENGMDATNLRIDRQTDAIGALQNSINGVSTKLEVLTQRLEIVVPLKRTELEPGILPSELRSRKN